MTAPEIDRVLKVARLRPLAEYGREIVAAEPDADRNPRTRATWSRAPLTIETIDGAVVRARKALKDNPAFIDELEASGRERALMYLVLLTTGLRKNELASLTIGQIGFSGTVAFVVLDPADEKNRQGSSLPLRADVAAELKAWLAGRLLEHQDDCRRGGQPPLTRLPADTPLFRVPSGLARILEP